MRKLTRLDAGLYGFNTNQHRYIIERDVSVFDNETLWTLKRVHGQWGEIIAEGNTLRDVRSMVSIPDNKIDEWS